MNYDYPISRAARRCTKSTEMYIKGKNNFCKN